jgi:histidyl-tRNA synthetase
MHYVGIPEGIWIAVCIQIDKMDKMPMETVQLEIEKLGVDKLAASGMLAEIRQPRLYGVHAPEAGSDSLLRLFDLAKTYGYSSWLEFDPTIVRGLSYYTDIVFEVGDRAGQLRALCGGGRYDQLLQSFTGKPESNIPAAGFGFGDAVIMELLREKNLLPKDLNTRSDVQAVVFTMDNKFRAAAVATATLIRAAGVNTDIILDEKPAKQGFSKANSLGASK